MIKTGIDTLAIYTPRYFLPLTTLAKARNVDSNKFEQGLGQYGMSVVPPGEDIVTMAANAGLKALSGINKNNISMLLFATESGIDQSKAAGIYVHDLLGLPASCRVVELKQACYSGTAALQLALPYLQLNPRKKILVIASDIARYGLNTTAESSQGAGAVAMVLSAHPRLVYIEPENAVFTDNVMDFWRPNYLKDALVEGKYSSKLYLSLLEKTWSEYSKISGRHFKDHDYFCYHTPLPRLVEKAHQSLLKLNAQDELTQHISNENIEYSLKYGRDMGNSYTAALYVSLTSLLDHQPLNLSGKRIGFYSYGSGCVAEFFSGVIEEDYKSALHTGYHQDLMRTRKELTYDEYESFYNFQYTEDGGEQSIPFYRTGAFRLSAMHLHKRIYERVPVASVTPIFDEALLAAG